MAKVSRNVLKGIIKECLIEILAEGIIGDPAPAKVNALESMLSEAPRKKRRKKTRAKPTNELDNDRFNSAVSNSVRSLTDDDVLASIFADTAKTTLQEQIGAEGKGPGLADSASRKMDQLDPLEVFGNNGQGDDYWAKLAFAGNSPGSNNKTDKNK